MTSSSSDSSPSHPAVSSAETTTALTTQLATILDPLGGRTALAARRFNRASAARATGHSHHAPASASTTADAVMLRAVEPFPAASLAKLCIAVELFRRADLGQFRLNERFDTSDEPRVGGGGVLDYLDPTVRLTLDDLCFLMLGVSDNTVANFLLDLVGIGEVNETMSRLNLPHTRLARHFMDFAARAAHRDNLTSAADIVALLSLVRTNALPGAARLREVLAAQQLDHDIVEWLPVDAHLAHKTGSLDDLFHDVGILTGPAGACVYCVLTVEQSHLPTARAAVGGCVRALWDAWCANV